MKRSFDKNYFYILHLLVLFLLVYSCKKNSAPVNQPTIPAGKDSCLLIKSIRYASKYVEEYYYNSINNKIILTAVTEDTSFPSNSKTELSYNNKHLLSQIITKFKQTPSSDTNIVLTATFTYDDQGILQKIERRDYYGAIKTSVFTKTLMPAGNYELKWLDQRSTLPNGTPISDTVQAVFNSGGQLISLFNNHPYPISGTPEDTTTSATITIDSFVYDSQGSISKISSSYSDTLRKIKDSFTYCQFTSRFNKGNNLYNQRQLLLQGISNIPLSTTILSGEAGVLSIFNDIHPLQYSKYPFQTGILHNYLTNEDIPLNASSEFDSKDRLTYFNGFYLVNDRPLQFPYAVDYRITYFK